ncbi:MAG: protein kinase domain-containing protein [Nanobdellota archaeon]
MMQPFLPDDFDFTGSTIEARRIEEQSILTATRKNYSFERYLASGSQGRVVLYSGDNPGNRDNKVVFKFYVPASSSTQNPDDGTDKKYKAQVNEKDFLSPLSFFPRMSAYYRELRESHEVKFDSNLDVLVDGDMMTRREFVKACFGYKNLERIQDDPYCITPQPIFKANCLQKDGICYNPLVEPLSDLQRAFETSSSDTSLYTYEEGPTLHDLLHDGVKDTNLAHKFLYTVSLMHWNGVMHRDLKPDNVVVNPDGRVTLLDCGIAMRFSPGDRLAALAGMEGYPFQPQSFGSPTAKNWFGSRLFSAPEHRLPQVEYSNKHDIFSCGVLAALIETGEHPYMPGVPYGALLDTSVKRTYADKLNRVDNPNIYQQFLDMHRSFKERHDLGYEDMFHIEAEKRPNRMSLVARQMGFQMPFLPPYFGFVEIGPERFRRLSQTRPFYQRLQEEQIPCWWQDVERA